MSALKNKKHERFCLEYMKDLNQTQAYIRSGYSKKGAKVGASKLLTIANVSNRVQELFDARSEELKYDAAEVLSDLVGVIRFDFRTLYDDHGDLLPPHKWPDEAVIAVQSVDVGSIKVATARDEEPLDLWTKKMKMESKLKAIELAGRHVDIRAWDNTVILDIPPLVRRNFTGRKDAGIDE